MRLEQYIGPFTSNQVIFNKDNVDYLQLGIEHPHSIPISELDDFTENEWPIIISINSLDSNRITSKDFIITEKDILELKIHNEIEENFNIKIIIKDKIDNPYLIFNTAYEDAT